MRLRNKLTLNKYNNKHVYNEEMFYLLKASQWRANVRGFCSATDVWLPNIVTMRFHAKLSLPLMGTGTLADWFIVVGICEVCGFVGVCVCGVLVVSVFSFYFM